MDEHLHWLIPLLAAALLLTISLLSIRTGWNLPAPMRATVGMLSDACIPAFLVVLGMQLVGRHWEEATIYRAAEAFESSVDWRTL